MRPNEPRGIRLRSNFLENPPPLIPALPVIGRVAAGTPILSDFNIKAYYHINPTLFSPPADYLLQVEGMSMRGVGILDGDLLAVKQRPIAKNGQVVVARLENEVTVKRFYRDSEALIRLEPENADYKTIKVDKTMDFAIEGISVGVFRNFDATLLE